MLRAITEQDLPTLADLYTAFDQKPDVEKMKQLLQQIAHIPGYHLLGVDVEGKLVATVTVLIMPDLCAQCRPMMIVENVAVSDVCRGKGIGKAMLKEVEEMAVKEHCCMINLVSSGFRTDAHRFYEQLGYTADVRGFRKFL